MSASKVPAVTLSFWVVKILATTLGETAGDAVSMSMGLGYLAGTAVFAVLFLVAVSAQVRAPRHQPVLYWATIVATTTVGTTLADFTTRSLGIGYPGGSLLLAALLVASLVVWWRSEGSIAAAAIRSPRTELFYWTTIMTSQTLGTALGDYTADGLGMGYAGAALLFGGLLAVVAALHRLGAASTPLLFWAAFVLTRPLGAVVGDLLDKPIAQGGLDLSRFGASSALLAAMALCLALQRRRA